MREILFRGQTRKKGEKVRLDGTPVDSNWVYGGVAQFNEERAIIYQTEPEFHKFAVYAETLGQFTGLTDKNGNKIFEGDILKAGNGHIGYADFSEGGFVLVCRCHSNLTDLYGAIQEVIGNVHDNPELLKDDEDFKK